MLSRYARAPILQFGEKYGTSKAITVIRERVASGDISYKEDMLREGDRIDIVAGREYGRADLFWVIAAASNIGWCLQCPPGTVIKIPRLEDVARFVG